MQRLSKFKLSITIVMMDLSKYRAVTRWEEYDSFEEIIVVEDAKTMEKVFYNRSYREQTALFKKKKPSFDQRFLTIDSFLKEFDGRLMVVEVAKKILPSPLFHYDSSLRQTISDIEGKIRGEIHSDFLSSGKGRGKHQKTIGEVLSLTMAYYDSPMAHVLLLGKGRQASLTSMRKGKPASYSMVHFPEYWDNSQVNFFQYGYSLLCEDLAGFAAFDKELASSLEENGIHTVLMIPFFIEARQSGFLILGNPKSKPEGFDLFLGDFSANSIGTLLYRGQIYDNLYFDSLTKLPYTNVAESQFNALVSENEGHPMVMMGCDLNDFRTYCRSYGYEKGDEILCQVADILRKRYPNSLVCRKFDTDSFLVIAGGLASNFALDAKKIQEELRAFRPEIRLSMTFGIYQMSLKEDDYRVAVLKTSFAHRAAKESKECFLIFDDGMAKRERYERMLTDRFHQAIENGEFEVFIQPRYNLESKTYYSGEALVRWRIDGKLLPPADFIPLFENNGLCRELDAYMLRKVCALQAKWLSEDPDTVLPLSLNYSRADFTDPELAEKTIAVIEESGIPTSLVEIEITESAYADFEGEISSFIEKCHLHGIHVLMDDFGAGRSSFSSLKNLDVDGIKLDYKFLGQSESDRKKRKIIESIVTLARSLRLPMVIEGLEKEADATYFRILGVRYIQGFLFGKPMPVEEFEKIANKKAEFLSSGQEDDRLIYDELVDKKSNINLLVDRMPLAAGLFRYVDQKLLPIYLNQRASEIVSKIGSVQAFLSHDLLDMLPPESKEKTLDCLNGPKEHYQFSIPRRVGFRKGMRLHYFQICSMLLKEEQDSRYLLLLGSPEKEEVDALPQAPSYTKKEFEESLAFGKRNYAIFDKDGVLLSYNDGAKAIFPRLEVGAKAEALFGTQAASFKGPCRFYDEKSDRLTQIEASPLLLDGENVIVCNFSPLSDKKLRLTLTAEEGYGFFERALQSLHSIASYYVEVDLGEDRFSQVNLQEDPNEKVYHQGSYSADYFPKLLKMIRKDDIETVQKKMNLSSLQEGYFSRAPFQIGFGTAKDDRFYRIQVRYTYDRGHRYACFYVQDISELHKKDFDALTGLYSRSAGKALMNRYIKEHPFDKMAFISFDIDGFKTLNDTYGHPLGDEVLSRIKNGLGRLPKQFDYFTRLGGDEFALLLTKRSKTETIEHIREAIAKSLASIGTDLGLDQPLGVSTGWALIPEEGREINLVYGSADDSLYQHKAQKKKQS